MDLEMTAEQKEKLITWAQQRDALLLEISNLRGESEKLQTINKEVAASKTKMEDEMNIILGRIEELKNREADLFPLVSAKIANLKVEKTSLEVEVAGLKKLIERLNSEKAQSMIDVDFALQTFEVLRDEALKLDKVVGNVTAVSNSNATKIDLLVDELAKSLKEIVDVNKKNVTETNFVIDKLPAMMLELQKAGLLKTREALIKIKS